MTTFPTPSDEAEARAIQDTLRARVVLDEPGPPPGTGRVTGVDVAYDDERDVVVAAAVVLDEATLDVLAETTAVGRITFPASSPSGRYRPCSPRSNPCRSTPGS
jgi:deoxyribonuclease V